MTTRTTSPPSTEPGPARAGAPVLARRAAFQRALPWVEDAEAGRPVAGAIVGPAGFGKSTLARAILEHAAARGVRTWMVAGLDPALEGLVASRLAAQLSIVDAGTQPAALIRATVEHLQRLGRSGRPVAICFDDLHAFHASDLALAQDLLLTRVPGLLVIATARPGRAASDDLLAHAREMAGARRVDLGPLSLEEATGLLAAVPGLGAVARRFTRDAVALARGEPARLLAIAAAVRDLPAAARGDVISGSRSLETLALPAPLAALALRACEGLDEDALQLLRALAVWGVPASTATLASLTRRNAGAVEDLAVRLERARLLVPAAIHGELGIAIADPLLALALASAPSIERGLLHRRAAQLLERAGAGPLDVPRAIRARHLVAGGLPFEAAAFDAILEAARELIEHSRYASARDLLAPLLGDAAPDRAASVPPEVFVLAAETLSRSGSLDRARKLLEQAGPADPAAPLRAARDLVALGREAQTLPIYRSMLANESLDPATRIRALVDSAWVQHMAGRPRDAERAGRDAARFAEALGDADLGARARLVLSNTHLATGHAGAALR
ncbi:MAG: hypothetical protein FJZ92_12265, partial [Chloroflexi bacterium]|nr:hypothetical protein [Chloroflexota bacterium]